VSRLAEDFPELADGNEGLLTLPCWAGFRCGDRPVSDGGADLTLDADAGGDEILPSHEAAYRHLLEHARSDQDAVLDALIVELPRLFVRYPQGTVPARLDREALRSWVELVGVHLHGAEREGVGYIGYQLGCAGDREHGLGVMTHAGRVVKVGHADTSILGWVAREDAEGPGVIKAPGEKKAAPKRAVPKPARRPAPQKAAPKKAAPRKPAPKKPAPKKPAPKKPAPKKPAPKKR
jgi:hypothetical protein